MPPKGLFTIREIRPVPVYRHGAGLTRCRRGADTVADSVLSRHCAKCVSQPESVPHVSGVGAASACGQHESAGWQPASDQPQLGAVAAAAGGGPHLRHQPWLPLHLQAPVSARGTGGVTRLAGCGLAWLGIDRNILVGSCERHSQCRRAESYNEHRSEEQLRR